MRVPPNHTDDQCRDSRHPKFNRQNNPKPENPAPHANETTAFDTQPQNSPIDNSTSLPPLVPHYYPYPPFPFPMPAPTNQPHPDLPHETPNMEGMFTLDSAAHPTHIHTPPSSLPRTSQISTRTAANHMSPCSHAGPIQIRLHPKHPPLRIPFVASPSMHSNLLSVHDTATQYRAVLFTPHHGYILNLYDYSKPFIVSTAPWHKNRYTLHSLPPSNPHSYSARITAQPSASHKPPRPPQTSSSSTPRTPILKQTHALPSKRHLRPLITPKLNQLPVLHGTPTPNPTAASFYNRHIILNHSNLPKLQRMAIQNTLPILPKALRHTPPPITCSTCPTAKQSPQPHPRKTHTYPVGSYISSDTCGPFKPPSRHGNLHFVSYLDASSRYLIAFFIPDSSSVKHTTPLAVSFITAQHGKTPHIYHSDNAREFQSNDMNHLYNLHGIQYRSNTPHQPQKNSLAERINRTIVTATRAALHHSNLDESFWEDAMRDVIFKYNILTHDRTSSSPHQLWHKHTPILPRLFAFGQLGTIPNYQQHKKKFEPRADPARFMHNTSPTHIVALNLRTNQYNHLRSVDFKPYFHHLDPLYHHPQSLATQSHSLRTTPPFITELTPPPPSTTLARQYPDSKLWATAHDTELDTLDNTNTIRWIPNTDIPP